MNFEINRVYRFIIDEVCKAVEEESILTNIDSLTIKELKTGWFEKISEYTDMSNFPDVSRSLTHISAEPSYKNTLVEDISCSDSVKNDDSSNEEDNCENLFMCLYLKVNKSKNKWKCHFKDGFVNIGPIDLAFSNAQGDLLW